MEERFKVSAKFGLDFVIAGVVGRMMSPQKCHMLTPKSCEYFI